jgi:phospholipid-translocating ATPase
MIIALVLFENEFLNVVAITFTALIVNELIMVALEITIWYVLLFSCLLRVFDTEIVFLGSPQARLHDHLRSRHPLHLRL